MKAVVEGVIAAGDVVAVRGDIDFFRALELALGDKAVAVVNADLDTRPDVHVGAGGLTFPKQPGRSAVSVSADARPDPRVFLLHVGETALQRDHLCHLASVVLDATSATFARMLKAGGAEVSGVGLQLIDGLPVVSRVRR